MSNTRHQDGRESISTSDHAQSKDGGRDSEAGSTSGGIGGGGGGDDDEEGGGEGGGGGGSRRSRAKKEHGERERGT